MLRVRTTMTGRPGAPYLSTMNFVSQTTADAANARTAVRNFWVAMAGFITNGLVIQVEGEVDLVDPATGNVLGSSSAAVAPVPATGNAPLPPATQGLIRWRTGVFLAGREIRGRTFIPALANDAQLVGEPSAAFITQCNTAADGLIADGAAAGNFGVWSPSRGQILAVADGSPWSRFAVLRSRRD